MPLDRWLHHSSQPPQLSLLLGERQASTPCLLPPARLTPLIHTYRSTLHPPQKPGVPISCFLGQYWFTEIIATSAVNLDDLAFQLGLTVPADAGASMEEAPRGQSYSDAGLSNLGSISNLGSVSQLGSMSQMGSIGTPSMPHSTNPSGGMSQSRNTSSLTNKVSFLQRHPCESAPPLLTALLYELVSSGRDEKTLKTQQAIGMTLGARLCTQR